MVATVYNGFGKKDLCVRVALGNLNRHFCALTMPDYIMHDIQNLYVVINLTIYTYIS